uniref:Uncharacterized protein n=1 Tax=Tetranychus urticae TaxID=32264 RepID=T1KYD7_TETUR
METILQFSIFRPLIVFILILIPQCCFSIFQFYRCIYTMAEHVSRTPKKFGFYHLQLNNKVAKDGIRKEMEYLSPEETFLAAMNNMTPEIACKTLVKLNNIISIAVNEETFGYGPYAESYVALVRKIHIHDLNYQVL